MNKFLAIALSFTVTLPAWAGDLPVEARIEQAMMGSHRSEANIDRNRYRHPVGSLTFLGVEDGKTVMEIWPGAGWYTEILAPVLRGKGQYIAATYDVDVPEQPEYRYRLQDTLLKKFAANPELYDQVAIVPFSPPQSSSLGTAESIDVLLTFRNTHGWASSGLAEAIYAEFARVLKPGGVLGVVQHRADAGAEVSETAENGYVSEAAVVDMARKAGLYLEARSEVNANPSDSKDHEAGVWTLPPNLSLCRRLEAEDEIPACEEQYRAIGESDRMTLRFRKPLQ